MLNYQLTNFTFQTNFNGIPLTNHIEWQTINYAMQRFNLQDRIQIWKIIRKWTPTQVSPGNYPSKEKDRLCPTCNKYQETPEHLLHCISTVQDNLRQKLKTQMSMLHIKHNLNPHLFQMCWLGMTTLENPMDHTIDLYPPIFHSIFRSQSQLGWKQLYYGQLSKEWMHFIGHNHPEIDATKFYAKLIQLVWEYVLEVWTTQNQDNNAATEQFPLNMLSKINGIYASCDHLPPQT